MKRSDLIYDVGVGGGKDTAFYLHKNYRVVAIEANPISYEQARQKFADEIECGKLTLLNVAITENCGETDFFINLSLHGWSSINPDYHPGTKVEKIKVQGISFDKLMQQYGVPHYLKVDIEGSDAIVLRQLQNSPEKPHFISVEESSIEFFPLLWSLGYRGFKIVNQEKVPEIQYDHYNFEQGSSGPFGDDAPGHWMPFGDAILNYLLNVRDCRGRKYRFRGWCDIHATLNEPAIQNYPYPRRQRPELGRLVRKGVGRLEQLIRHRQIAT